MAYSTEIRETALKYCSYGMTDEQVSEKLDVSKQTIGNWKKLLFDTGSLEKKKVKRKSGKPYKYTPEKIKGLLEKNQVSTNMEFKDSGNGSNPVFYNLMKSKNKKKKKK